MTRFLPRPAPLALAISLALGAGSLWAQAAAPVAAPREISIPTQPLGDALNAWARQTRTQIAVQQTLVVGKTAPAVSGSLTPRQALDQLLAGSGLVADVQGGEVTIRRAPDPAAGEVALPAVTVTAEAERSSITEGTGSYTSASTNTATGLGLSIRETPQSVSVVTRQRMEDQGLTQLTDVVTQTAGLSLSQGGNVGSDSSPIHSRGFSVDNYMIDGVKLLESYSSIFQSQDMALYDRVEIVRGATGLMNGTGTPSAAINLVRKRPAREFQASARLELGSWDYRRADVDVSSPLNASGSVRGRLVAAVQDAASYIDRLNEDRTVLYGVVEADLTSATKVSAGVSQQRHDSTGHARGGLPAYYSDGTRTQWKRSDTAAPTWAYSKRHSTSAFAELAHIFDNGWELKAHASRTITDSDELVGYASGGNPDRLTGEGVSIWATRWKYKPNQDVLDVSASGQFGLLGRQHDLTAGATHARSKRDGDPAFTNWWHTGWSNAVPNIYNWDGTDPAAPYNPSVGTHSSDVRSNSVFGSVRLRPTDALSVILGSRVTDWRRTTANHSYSTDLTTHTLTEEKGQVIPYAGVVFDLDQHWSVYGSYTTIFQPQSQKTVAGDYLDPLMGNGREVGVKGAFYDNRLNISGALYETAEDNKAIAIPDTFAPDGSQAYRSASGTKSRGFEVEVAGQVLSGWELAASFARNLTRDRDGEPLNTSVPQNTAKLFTTYRIASVGHGLVVGGGVRWQNEIYSDNLGPERVRFTQPSYAVVDLMARYAINRKTTAFVNLNNVFDKSYHATTGNSYYGAPRSVRVGLDMRF